VNREIPKDGVLRTQRSADISVGLFLSILGIVVVLAAAGIKGGIEERLPPHTLPLILGWTIIVAGAALTLRAWFHRETESFIKWPALTSMVRVLVTLFSLAIYIALVSPLGLPLATLPFITFLVWYLGRSHIIFAVIVGLLSSAVVYLLFIRLLELSFPVGPLGG
jgi:putative tricarboxylic transport membrane protein